MFTLPRVSGVEPTAPDGANKLRQLLMVDMDHLLKEQLKEQQLRMAEHVDERMEDLYQRLAKLSRNSMKSGPSLSEQKMNKISQLIPRVSTAGGLPPPGLSRVGSTISRASAWSSAPKTPGQEEAPVAVQGRLSTASKASTGSSFYASEAAVAPQKPAKPAPENRFLDMRFATEKRCTVRLSPVVPEGEDEDASELGEDNASEFGGRFGSEREEDNASVAPRVSTSSKQFPRARTIRYSVGSTDSSREPQGDGTSTAALKRVKSIRYSQEMKDNRQMAVSKSMSPEDFPGALSENTEATTTSTRDIRSLRAMLRGVVDSTAFESVSCVIIVINAMFIGAETQFTVSGNKPGYFDIIALLFTGLFTFELMVRILVAGRQFYANDNRLWNFADTSVVFISLVQTAFEAADVGAVNLTHVRIIRIARIVRIFQVIRALRFFSSLRILIHCVLNTLRSLVWTMLLLLGILYIFGILFTQAAWEVLSLGKSHFTDLREQQHFDNLERYFGGLQLSIFTLFKVVTDGLDWDEVSTPLSWVHPSWEILFTIFISFTYFAVLNVVTGVFCQSAIESASHDKDVVVQAQLSNKKMYTRRLRELFQRIDVNHSGQIDFVSLESCLRDPQFQAYFEFLGVTADDAWNLFKLLDADDSCVIELDEFVSGCLRLQGNSRSIDSHMLLYESRWTMSKLASLLEAFNGLLEILSTQDTVDTKSVRESMDMCTIYEQFEQHAESRPEPVRRRSDPHIEPTVEPTTESTGSRHKLVSNGTGKHGQLKELLDDAQSTWTL